MNEQEWEDKLAEVQKHSEHWYNKYKELENKIADIKASCDLAIEGRDIKIKELELELTVEKDQHQEETNLHLHAEDYIKSLEQQIEKMKCCQNCKHCAKIHDYDLDDEEDSNIEYCEVHCYDKSGWELRR